MIANSTSMRKPARNTCLGIGLDLKIDYVEDEHDVKVATK